MHGHSTHLAIAAVLRLEVGDRRAGEGQLLADPAQAEQQDRAEGEVRVHVRAGDAHLHARRRGRDRRRRNDADRRRA